MFLNNSFQVSCATLLIIAEVRYNYVHVGTTYRQFLKIKKYKKNNNNMGNSIVTYVTF